MKSESLRLCTLRMVVLSLKGLMEDLRLSRLLILFHSFLLAMSTSES